MTTKEKELEEIFMFCFWKCRGIERIGEESPASTTATDTFVLKEIAQLVKEEEGEIKSIMECVVECDER